MWSKTRQVLESRLADGLKGRVSYHWDVYRRDGKCPTECHVMSIFVDGECWFHTNQRFWDVKYGTRPEPKDNDIIRETGNIDNEPEWFRKWILLQKQISAPSTKKARKE